MSVAFASMAVTMIMAATMTVPVPIVTTMTMMWHQCVWNEMKKGVTQESS